jgi:D-arabinose 1-dehydrogenase-like Zn-dependent alcohol dehydrogenase
MIRMDETETAYERIQRSDLKYRFVIDRATIGTRRT